MQIQGKVIDIEFEVQVPKANNGGTYLGTTLTYKDSQGKVQTKSWTQTALNHAANAHVKAALQSFTKGTNFVAESVKNDAGFWNWTDLKIVSGNEAGTKETKENNYATSKVNSTWQTAEERAQTQIYIIRQNAITNAVNWLSANLARDPETNIESIFKLAKEFEKHVLGIREEALADNKSSLADLENDIPY